MTVKTGQAWAGAFVTLDATGALATPSKGPAGVLYVDGVANAATVTITGSNPYKWAVTLPSLTAGQRVDMYITATISKIATAGFVASEQADTALVSEVKAETASILEDTGTTIPGTITTIDNEIAVIDGIVDSILEDTGTTLDTKINTIDDFLDTEVAAILADTNELQTDWVNGGRLDSLIDAIKTKTDTITTPPTAASVADAVWDEAIADHTTATTFGGKNQKVVPSETIGDYKADVSGLATTTHVQEVEDKVDTIDGNVDAVLLDTGTDGVKIASGELSDLALEATLTAMKGAGWTDETLVALMTAIKAISAGSGATAQEVWEYTTRVLTAGTNIDISSLATAANLAALDGKVDTVDGIVDAILADTNELQTDLTDGGRLDLLIDAIKTKTDTITTPPTAASVADAVWDEAIADHTTATTFGGKNQKVVPSETIGDYKADVSGLATSTALTTVSGLVDDLETRLTAARAGYLDNLNTGVTLTAAGVDAIVDEVVVGTYTMRQLLTVFASALAGKLSGGGTTTLTFRGINDASDVIVATVDANGNRSDLTITV